MVLDGDSGFLDCVLVIVPEERFWRRLLSGCPQMGDYWGVSPPSVSSSRPVVTSQILIKLYQVVMEVCAELQVIALCVSNE